MQYFPFSEMVVAIYCLMVVPQPMSLVQQPEPFDNWDWIYKIKHDGFRALAVFEQGQCRFFSRKKHKLTDGAGP
jgi:ATP-dependent DNA ligase